MNAKHMTGRTMTLIFCGFFGVVIAVNMLMATIASRTFGGVVVENSYVASQEFNRWLAQSREQDRLGWNAVPGVATDRRVTVRVSARGATASGIASHPLGRLPDVLLRFHPSGGLLVSDQPLPPGRWQVRLIVRRGREIYRVAETLS